MNFPHIFILVCILVIASTIWFKSPASSEDMTNIISQVNNSSSEEVKSRLVVFLKDTPNPTRQQLSDFRDEVDQILVVDLARQATGDNSLQAKSPETKAHPAPLKTSSFIQRFMVWMFCLGLATIVTLGVYRIFQKRKSDQL